MKDNNEPKDQRRKTELDKTSVSGLPSCLPCARPLRSRQASVCYFLNFYFLSILIAVCLLFTNFGNPAWGQNQTKKSSQWGPYLEFSLDNPSYEGNPFDLQASATFTHAQTGEQITTGMFYDGGDTWNFRFTGTMSGAWHYTTRSEDPELDGKTGTATINKASCKQYGFVKSLGNRWARQKGKSGQLEPFVPQYVMYAHPAHFYNNPQKIEADIQTFMVEHSFSGFHTYVFNRWFDLDHPLASDIPDNPNPDIRTFEALEMLISKVHQAGGVVHIWAWGDEAGDRQTPIKFGINGRADKRLQRYIAARLGPLPGWTMGYGYDLWEWVNGQQLSEWHRYMHEHFGWPHMLGGRSEKNQFTQISEALDYSSYEQHQPDYATYVGTIEKRPHKPSFSEDRFRIRQPSPYPMKDYTYELTRKGLWNSAMAGGVANIWGNLVGERQYEEQSAPYPKPEWIKTYATFFENRYIKGLERDNAITDGRGLKHPDNRHFLFYKEDTDIIRLTLDHMDGRHQAVAVDTKKPYKEIKIGPLTPEAHFWEAPYQSDWAIAVGDFEK